MKLEYIVLYAYISDKFDNRHCQWDFSPFNQNTEFLCKVGEVHIGKHKLSISDFEQARVLILDKYVPLRVINTMYKHCHA